MIRHYIVDRCDQIAMVHLPLMPLFDRVIVDLGHQESLETEQAMQVGEGSDNDVAGASKAMREFSAMCRAILLRECPMQTVVAASRRRCHEMLSPQFRGQGLTDELRPLSLGMLVES